MEVMGLKLVCISDTHNNDLTKLKLPEGDILIHSGDFTMMGTLNEVRAAMGQLKEIANDYGHVVFTAGNHDWLFERQPEVAEDLVPKNCVYLNDSETTIEGLEIYASPITPWFGSWAFNKHVGQSIQRHWDMIPTNTDILITHGPAYGILDTVNNGAKEEHCGCIQLLRTIHDKVQPKLHICGHIHEGHGILTVGKTTFINGSLLDDYYHKVYDPIVFDI